MGLALDLSAEAPRRENDRIQTIMSGFLIKKRPQSGDGHDCIGLFTWEENNLVQKWVSESVAKGIHTGLRGNAQACQYLTSTALGHK